MPRKISEQQAKGPEQCALPPDEILFGCTPAMRAIRQQLEKVSNTNVPVLLQGEGGTGKELLARWVHFHSACKSGPFVKINFAAIPGTLLESELFGYQVGAFTGANNGKLGRVELAQGGSLFLDQLTDLESSFQAKLLQLLQDGRFCRLGDQEERRVDARIICASTRRLEEAVQSGQFRQDLYYRLNVFTINVPPLSARLQDVPGLAEYLVKQLSLRFQREATPLDAREVQLLQCRELRGNIREMENWVARYVLLGEEGLPKDEVIRGHRNSQVRGGGTETMVPLKQIARQAGKAMSHELILKALRANRWNRRGAARDLKISYRKLLYEIREIGLPSKTSNNQAQNSRQSSSATIPSTD
jgi:transcriptional regulator with PAS, ATPase and Fis domain